MIVDGFDKILIFEGILIMVLKRVLCVENLINSWFDEYILIDIFVTVTMCSV